MTALFADLAGFGETVLDPEEAQAVLEPFLRACALRARALRRHRRDVRRRDGGGRVRRAGRARRRSGARRSGCPRLP